MMSPKHEKEMRSFKNRLGKNIVWFDSLPERIKRDIFFSIKRDKWIMKSLDRQLSFRSRINHYKKKYKVSSAKMRNTALEKLLK
jgi:hypothetical protein